MNKLKNYTVTEINTIIRNLLFDTIGKIIVTGEASNVKYHTSGHLYFSLKDENNSVIRCVMFRYYANQSKSKISNGMEITVTGNIDVYTVGGYYQIKVFSIEKSGEGDLLKKFEELKTKLNKEGLFDKKYKKDLPKHPKTIGVITSETGAAIQDIIRVISNRYPIAKILLYSADVQGENAKYDVVKGLEYFNNPKNNVDVIISGRGGGSMEDLWAFNEEIVARAIFKSKIPVISAVGHEIDYTISDFVADRRAATPSAGAEIAVPDLNDILDKIINSKSIIKNNLVKILKYKKSELLRLSENRYLLNPYLIIEEKIQRIDMLKEYMLKAIKNIFAVKEKSFKVLKEAYALKNIHYQVERRKEKLNNVIQKLTSNFNYLLNNKKNLLNNKFEKLKMLSPLNILDRGYSIVTHNKKIIKTSVDININDTLEIKFAKGKCKSVVKNIEE